MEQILNKEDIQKLSREDLKTLMLEFSIAGYNLNQIIEKLGMSRPSVFAVFSADPDFSMQFKYAQHMMTVALNEFIKLSNDGEKYDLINELCRYLPWSMVIGCDDIVDNCIAQVYESLGDKDNFDLLAAFTEGRTAYFSKLKESSND